MDSAVLEFMHCSIFFHFSQDSHRVMISFEEKHFQISKQHKNYFRETSLEQDQQGPSFRNTSISMLLLKPPLVLQPDPKVRVH